MEEIVTYRYNITKITSIEDFAAVRGRYDNHGKDVYFAHLSGQGVDVKEQLRRVEEQLSGQMQAGTVFYRRICGLPVLKDADDVWYYTQCYDRWRARQQEGLCTKVGCGALAVQLGAACRKTLEAYQQEKASMTETIRKNFAVKLLYWFDHVCDGLSKWSGSSCMKIVADDTGKEQEYLFYYFLTLTGCDVLLLQSSGNLSAGSCPEQMKQMRSRFCQEIRVSCVETGLSKTAASCVETGPSKTAASCVETGPPKTADAGKIVVKIPQRNRKKQRRVKSFEELAALASSIVLILVHDRRGEVISTGSGIMVGRDGYLLTNDHVVRGGASYSVRIENDEQVYHTDELIKYHTTLDLALLRIQRRLAPLPVYQEPEPLVRGQAVAAIGSPLGLFNSVSDGIISGFRTINGVHMIQFTAPVSPGSSGGAVLNLYGEVIGICTAGYERGQNINLAVGYESISLFLQGFWS